ncbi:TonB-dependent receptor plug domain-containing protein [Pseudoflavitalea sp. G-6-1-2]|uniref:TonB-dependent receptor n=1 Tax=Pseudoflavitalea sp. G-6-1-2 TaxID=2728841 RepID=UPI00146A151C|nr:TonB-dependent receptor [Pseudoflavitalea sp. G-6-1-2]NML20502.1 TonB-dependent receptor plug domain-containing protein [Pseudoflavitalea sp. G-6-1-2]
MLKVIPLILITMTSLLVNAQTVLQGKIKDGRGRGVGGASIAIKNSYDGGTTDSLGNYRFRTSEKGEQTIIITCIGYKMLEQKYTLQPGTQSLDLVLKVEPNELTAVTITAGTFEASDTKRVTVLGPIDIVTTAGSNGDVTGALKTLPGAQQVGEKEGLFVRGGSAEETKVFIDGTLVNNFFLSSAPDLASRGRFSPFIFKGTVFSTGGYSALYGGALSSALILESIDLPERTSADIGLSPIGVNAGYNHLAKDKKSSWGISYSYTNLAAYFGIVKQRPDNFIMPEYHNSEANFRIKTSKTGILKFYGYFNYGQFGIRRPDVDSTGLKNAFSLYNFNVYANLSWKEKIGKKWKIYLGTSYSNNIDKIRNVLENSDEKEQFLNDVPYNTKTFNLKSTADLAQIKAVLERRLYGLSAIRFGGEYLYFTDKSDFTNRYVQNGKITVNDHFKAGFAEADIYITNDLAAKLGTRVEHSSLLDKANIVPRASLAYKLGKDDQMSVAYGIFYQRPEKTFFLQNYVHNDLAYTRASHYIVNYQRVSKDYTLRLEAFYKKYDELVKTYSTKGNYITDSAGNGGYGKAQGFELFWRDRKTLKDVDYWISYSYLDTKRDYLNYPYAIQPGFAANHTVSLIVKKFVTKLKTGFNASYSFATGRPYYNIRYNEGQNKFTIAEQGKTITYNNLSFSVNYLPSIGKKDSKKFTVWVFSVTNVLGSDQIFGYNYSFNGSRKDPILPAARRFFYLGCFISFGIDRTQDVINGNL